MSFTTTLTLADGSTEQRLVYEPDDVVLPVLQMEPRGRGAKEQTPDYYDAICCLDTETSKQVHDELVGDQTVTVVTGVWIYQWALGINDTLVAGRSVDQLLDVLKKLVYHYELGAKKRMAVYIHNAAFDLSYLLNGLWTTFDGQVELFATGQRRPIRVEVCKGLELRCSYKLTNKSLDAWCKDSAPIRHKKLVGAIDYNVTRTPSSELTQTDWDYMLNDVCCQQDCLRVLMQTEHLRTVPMTSTGFVRRSMREAARHAAGWRQKFRNTLPTAAQYLLMHQAFIGGYTHCNSLAMGIWHDALGVDAASMYPAVLATEWYPCGKWYWREVYKYKDLRWLVHRKNYATIATLTFEGLQLRDLSDWRPYLPYSKAIRASTGEGDYCLDNGKVISCRKFTVSLCDLDMRIVFDQYQWDRLCIHEVMVCKRGPLPDWFLDTMRGWYADKVQLKAAPAGETEEEKITRMRRYAESKAHLNAIYGMCATAWTHDVFSFDYGKQSWNVPHLNLKEEDLKKFEETMKQLEAQGDYEGMRKAKRDAELKAVQKEIDKMAKPWSQYFLRYDWGLYCTAWARTHLWRAMECCGFPLYCDTDSVKGCDWNMEKLEEYNRELRAASDAAGFTIPDPAGRLRPIGVFEPDGEYKRFSALHAKCYAYEDYDGKLHATIAGVTTSNGKTGEDRVTKEEELGSLEELKDGKVFRECGGTRSVYIDHAHMVRVGDEVIRSYGGCAILDTTYEIGGVNDLIAMYGLSDPELPYK